MNYIIIPDKEMNSYITKLNPNFVFNLPRKKTEIKSYSDEEWEKL